LNIVVIKLLDVGPYILLLLFVKRIQNIVLGQPFCPCTIFWTISSHDESTINVYGVLAGATCEVVMHINWKKTEIHTIYRDFFYTPAVTYIILRVVTKQVCQVCHI
jgi:hypothetical protein